MVERHRPDVVLMDIRMPRLDGIEATRRLRQRHPDVRVIALTTYADDESVLGALRAGARGYLTKDASSDDIRSAILTVAGGEAALDPAVQHHVVAALSDGDAHAAAAAAPCLPDELTAREAQVLALIAEGLSNSEIAARLTVNPNDRQVTHQSPVREGRYSRPRPGSQLRLPQRARDSAELSRGRAEPVLEVRWVIRAAGIADLSLRNHRRRP